MDGAKQVTTSLGRILGSQAPGGVHGFRGIPYAAAPTHSRRFRPPAPVEPWSDTRDGSQFGPVAPQNASILDQVLGREPVLQDEDCLNLNVWTPDVEAALPVMVFIHGGAFINGSGSGAFYDGAALAARGAVVVTLNYRLGALGFLHLQDPKGEYDGAGNLGILDQVAALQWVKREIAAFGGDPNRVTVFGESAGSFSVATLLGVPKAAGLFQRAILQSGTAEHLRSVDEARVTTETFIGELGIQPGDHTGLQDAPVDKILAAQARVLAQRPTGLGGVFQPVVDGTVLAEHPHEAVRRGVAAQVDLMAGTNLDEAALWLAFDPSLQDDEDALLRRFEAMVPNEVDPRPVVDAYARELGATSTLQVWARVLTDAIFRLPMLGLVEAHLARGGNAHVYLFDWAAPTFGGRLGACHGLELPFVFDNLGSQEATALTGPLTAEIQELATSMADAWVSFASTGDPGWPSYDVEGRSTQVFGVPTRVVRDPHGVQRAAW